MDQKKPYTPPTVTDHGKVTTETKGVVSVSYEAYGRRLASDEELQ
jgi:hypothetical protein